MPSLIFSTQQWQWQTQGQLSYLTCDLLKDWEHGFFTKHCSPKPPRELVKSLNPHSSVYQVKQVHGNTVVTPSEITIDNNYPADGLITEKAKEAVWVASADCTPVLVADVKTGKVAAIHSGWRGTAKKIVPQAIARLEENGSVRDNLLFALGPAISGEVYQVSETVAAEVCASLDLTLEEAWELSDSPLLTDPEVGKVRLDIRKVIKKQLTQTGIKAEQIAIAPYCTYQHSDYFFSYRRTQAKNIQWSGIVSKL